MGSPIVALGDLNDHATVRGSHALAGDVGVTFGGGGGNDVLIGGRSPDTFTRGGPGNDRMVGGRSYDGFSEGPARSGADLIVGGPHNSSVSDHVSYDGRRGSVRANMNGRRDDGAPGERDKLVGISSA